VGVLGRRVGWRKVKTDGCPVLHCWTSRYTFNGDGVVQMQRRTSRRDAGATKAKGARRAKSGRP